MKVLTLKLKPVIAAKAKENQEQGINQYSLCQKSDKPSIDTKKEIAQAAGVSHDTIAKVERIEQQATPEIATELGYSESRIFYWHRQGKNEFERTEPDDKNYGGRRRDTGGSS